MKVSSGTSVLKTKYFFLMLSVLCLSALMLLPLLHSGFISDDILNSLIRGTILLEHKSLLHYFYVQVMPWVHVRFTPFNLLCIYTIFYFFPSLLSYKLLILLSILVNLVMFGYLIKLMTRSFLLGILAIFIVSLLFQFRLYHDPILSFGILLQATFFFLFISFILLFWYLQREKWYYLVISLLTYLAAMWTYEITYLFFILHFLLILFYSKNKRFIQSIKTALPFFILFIICVLIPIGLRVYFNIPLVVSGSHSAYVINLSIAKFFITFVKQIVAALPLSYFSLSYYFSGLHLSFTITAFVLAVLYFIFFLLISKKINKENSLKETITLKPLLLFGVGLWLLPGILTSLSPKYQSELTWGLGYLPVYVSYFGIAMLIVYVLQAVYIHYKNSKIHFKLWSVIFGAIFSIIAVFTYNCNLAVIHIFNSQLLFARNGIQKAMHAGLFNHVKLMPQTNLLADGRHPWDIPAFFLMESGVRFSYVGDYSDFLKNKKFTRKAATFDKNRYRYDFHNQDNIYYLRYVFNSSKSGYAIFSHIKTLFGSDKLSMVGADKTYIYVTSPLLSDDNRAFISGDYLCKDKIAAKCAFGFERDDMQLVARGSNWRMFLIKNNNTRLVNSMSVVSGIISEINMSSNSRILFSDGGFFTNGWSPPEKEFRWNSGNMSTIVFMTNKDVRYTGELLLNYAAILGEQKMVLKLNGVNIYDNNVDGRGLLKIKFDKKLLRKNKINTLSFYFPMARTPGNGDPRVLALAFKSLLVH